MRSDLRASIARRPRLFSKLLSGIERTGSENLSSTNRRAKASNKSLIMNSFVMRIDPTAHVRCFYTEAIDLGQIGRLEVHRASTVEFNDHNQQWEVRDPAGLFLYSHPPGPRV